MQLRCTQVYFSSNPNTMLTDDIIVSNPKAFIIMYGYHLISKKQFFV